MKSPRQVGDPITPRVPFAGHGAGPKRVCVARIGAAHGVRGDVKLWSFTADPMAIASYGMLETADGARGFEIESVRAGKDSLIARFKDVADRTAAERLCNLELFVPRERLPQIEDDNEFYYADLVGLVVVDPSGAVLGSVVAVHNFGAGDVLEVSRAKAAGTVMLPFTAAAVPLVDIEHGRVVVAPSEDLFEPPAAASRSA